MLKILQHIEDMAAGASLLPFATVGAALVLAGLIVWLGGLRFSRFISLLVGALTGFAVGMPFVNEPSHAAIAAVIGAVVGAVLNKYMMVIFGAAAVFFIGMTISVSSQLADNDFGTSHSNGGTLVEIIDEVPKLLANYADQAWIAIKDTGTAGAFTGSVVVALGVVVAGIFWPRLVAAAAYSAIGTTVIFIGMVMVLLNKGSEPVTRISRNFDLYIIASVSMVLFGTLTQLVLCKPAKKKITTKNDGDE